MDIKQFGRPKADNSSLGFLLFVVLLTPYFFAILSITRFIDLGPGVYNFFVRSGSMFTKVYPLVAGLVFVFLITLKSERQLFRLDDGSFALVRMKLKGQVYKSNYLPPMLENGDLKKWSIILFVLVCVQMVVIGFADDLSFRQVPLVTSTKNFLYTLIFIAFVEEMWFRGIWFWASRERFVLSVLGSAVFFGCIHIPQGSLAFFVSLGLGFIYGCARWRGASVLGLAIVHSFFNWQHKNFIKVEYDQSVIEILPLLLLFSYLVIGVGLLFVFKPDARVK